MSICIEVGRGGGIRTHGGFLDLNSFQDYPNKPL